MDPKETFNTVPELYDRVRPGYPESVLGDRVEHEEHAVIGGQLAAEHEATLARGIVRGDLDLHDHGDAAADRGISGRGRMGSVHGIGITQRAGPADRLHPALPGQAVLTWPGCGPSP